MLVKELLATGYRLPATTAYFILHPSAFILSLLPRRASGDDLAERGEEGLHVFARADGDAHVVRQRGEEPAHLDAGTPHGFEDGPDLAAHVNHHEVRRRGDVAQAHLVQLGADVRLDLAVQASALL